MFCLLASYAAAQSTDSLFLRTAYLKLERARDYTLEVARLMPAEKYSFRPTPEEMSFAEQVVHLAANLGWLSSSYLRQGEENPVSKEDFQQWEKEAVLAVVEKTYRYALDALRSLPSQRLDDSVEFFAGPMQTIQIVNLMNDHQTHHRAQLVVYLRLNGIKPPRYVGW